MDGDAQRVGGEESSANLRDDDASAGLLHHVELYAADFEAAARSGSGSSANSVTSATRTGLTAGRGSWARRTS
ncbi:hypothetical protein [Halorussus sp. AFM4]|uniref:hypothetical protein n=1 Tax=Halorussus sp. AFM4 TaxID=3421651 RepID=UPI003EB9544C